MLLIAVWGLDFAFLYLKIQFLYLNLVALVTEIKKTF